MNSVCEHGHQARKCEVCERDNRIADLEEAVRVLASEAEAWRYLADSAEDSSWSTAWREHGESCSDAEENTNNNPIAAAAVRKASDGNG